MCLDGIEVCPGDNPAVGDTSCNGLDDDCDGETDEDYASIECGTGACTSMTVCVDGEPVCPGATPAADDATCDAVDDDCDGETDEDYLGTPTECGTGACYSTGTLWCAEGVETNSCVEAMPSVFDDTTCDGIDDDCDGVTDEDYQHLDIPCAEDACVSTSPTACVDGITVDTCVDVPVGCSPFVSWATAHDVLFGTPPGAPPAGQSWSVSGGGGEAVVGVMEAESGTGYAVHLGFYPVIRPW